jgi:hypothetical protein
MMARRIRARVLPICDAWLKAYEQRQERNKSLTKDRDRGQEEMRWVEEKYWVSVTKAWLSVFSKRFRSRPLSRGNFRMLLAFDFRAPPWNLIDFHAY